MKMQKRLIYCLLFVLVLTSYGYAGGPKYVLTYCRMLGYYSNHNPVGNHVIHVQVSDENGQHLSGVRIVQAGSMVEHGRTDFKGYLQLPLQTDVHYELMVDEPGVESDVTPRLCADFDPYYGHHSYVVHFLKVSDGDTVSCDPFNPPYDYNITNFNNCGPPDSTHNLDECELGNWSGYFAQSFVATTNRIVAASIQASRGNQQKHTYTARIREGTPDGRGVGTTVSVPTEVYADDIFPVIVTWPLEGAKLTIGQTYWLRFDMDGTGANAYHTLRNNYSDGYMCQGGQYLYDNDLTAFIIGVNVSEEPTTPTPTGVPTNAPTNTPGGDCISGDTDCNSSVTPGDALIAFQIYLQQYIVTGNEPCDVLCAADIDQSGSITPGDALCIFKTYLNQPCD